MDRERKGIFITFEGGEGSGKTTHAKKLADHLLKTGHDVLLTREPGATELGKRIRDILLCEDSRLEMVSELMLFAADRMEHVKKVICPALAGGSVVICDRFIDSTSAYQIGGRGLPEDLVRYINMVSSDGLMPDLTLLFDLPPDIGLLRASGRKEKDRFEREDLPFHNRVRAYFSRIASEDPSRVGTIDSLGAFDEVHSIVLGRINALLNERKAG